MKLAKIRYVVGALLLSAPILLSSVPAHADSGGNATVLTAGLLDPRGLTFGPDGQLYVAEGGRGGTTLNTVGQCEQVPFPVGPYTSDGTNSARISRINPTTGIRTTVAANLPSSQTNLLIGGDISGVADVAFLHGTLYGLISGAGCSHGLANTHNSVVRINADGTTTEVANLSAFLMTHPVANPETGPTSDFEPDGTWYGMTSKGDSLYAVEPNHQEMDRIEPNGDISRVVDFSKTFVAPADWRGPTAITNDGGTFYVGTLTPFPIVRGAAQVFEVNPDGHVNVFADGATTVLGLAVDKHDRVYVLEMSDASGFPTPGMGKIVRISNGAMETIASGLSLPTGMTLGPDGNLYVSNMGFGFPPGFGEIVKVTVSD